MSGCLRGCGMVFVRFLQASLGIGLDETRDIGVVLIDEKVTARL